jgi:hypothetical protein
LKCRPRPVLLGAAWLERSVDRRLDPDVPVAPRRSSDRWRRVWGR